jgi:hypothetical protein
MVNKAGLKAMRTTIDDTVRWVTATAASSETSSRRIAQLRAMLAP